MGIEIEYFVYPERISPELICPICHNVVEKPVQTPSEHLFCEDELLEWMLRSDLCPITHQPLDPNTIKKPGRIITNMLGALERYCCNKDEGCKWKGTCDRFEIHLNEECEYQKQKNIFKELEEKNNLILSLQESLSSSKAIITHLEHENNQLWEENELLKRKLKVYDAFFERNTNHDLLSSDYKDTNSNNHNNQNNRRNDSKQTSDVSQLSRLRGLETLSSDSKEKVRQIVKL